jgi:hypothetical protein
MFADLSHHQLDALTKVHEAAAKASHWRQVIRNEVARALAGGCTDDQLATVTGLSAEAVRQLLQHRSLEFTGVHPTDPHAPTAQRC